jgi:hypothetical protein
MFHTHKKFISLKFVHKFVHIPVSEHFSFARLIQMWHIKTTIKHDHFTDAPCAGDNKRLLLNVQFCPITQCHRGLKFEGARN